MGSGVQSILTAFADGEVTELKQRDCLGLKLKQPVCGLCAAVCSSGALTANKRVRISQDRCDQCGRCASVCPTGYLRFKGFSSEIVEKISQRIERGQQTLVFTCHNSQHQLPDAVTVPCLSSLRAGYLVYWVSLGAREIVYDLSGCAACVLEAQKCLHLELKRARNIIGAWHLPAKIITSDSLPAQMISKDCASSLQLSRRGFFEYLGRRAKSVTKNIVGSYLNDQSNHTTFQLPDDRLYLLEALKRLDWIPVEQFSTGDLPWLDLVISGKCNGCHVCSTFCPTGALKRYEVNGNIEIRFLAARCVACGFCIAACPQHSLQLAKRVNIAMLRKQQVLTTGVVDAASGPGGFMHEV